MEQSLQQWRFLPTLDAAIPVSHPWGRAGATQEHSPTAPSSTGHMLSPCPRGSGTSAVPAAAAQDAQSSSQQGCRCSGHSFKWFIVNNGASEILQQGSVLYS